jgi:uncharacterized membrane protein
VLAINNHGRVVGQSGNGHAVAWGRFHPYNLNNSGWFSLDPVDLHPHLNAKAIKSEARDINDAGVIVGAWSDQHVNIQAFQYSVGVATDLPYLEEDVACVANSINDIGHIVGVSWNLFLLNDDKVAKKAVHWSLDFYAHDLGRLPPVAPEMSREVPYWAYEASSINNNGDICGGAYYADQTLSHAFGGNITGGLYMLPSSANVGYPYGYQSWAHGINASGRIVGESDRNPAIWSNGQALQTVSIGTNSYGRAYGVNKFGQAVGTYRTTNDNRAWFWDGVLHDLNDLIDPASGWLLRSARGINNQGQIVGNGVFKDPNDPNAKSILQGFRASPPGWDVDPLIFKFEEWLVYQKIIDGVVDDSPGHVWTPNGPKPIDPWNPNFRRVPVALRGLVSAAKIHLESQYLVDPQARANIESTAREMLVKELKQFVERLERVDRQFHRE